MSFLKEVLVLLGVEGIRKWLTVVLLGNISEDRPREIAVLAVIRGRFCELLGERIGLKDELSELFIVGLFSLIEAMVRRPKEELMKENYLAKEIKDALLGKENILSDILNLVIAWEEVEEEKIQHFLEKLKLSKEEVNAMYWETLRWASKIFVAEK